MPSYKALAYLDDIFPGVTRSLINITLANEVTFKTLEMKPASRETTKCACALHREAMRNINQLPP